MHLHILGMPLSTGVVPAFRLGIVAVLALVALAVPAPARAAPDASANASADLCARVGSRAGFTGDRLVTAVAVGMGESSCRANAQNANGPSAGCPHGSVDRGLWQINSCHHPSVSRSCAYDAQCNANAALRISARGANFRPWVAYTSGAYRKHLPAARAAVNRLGRV